MKTLQISEEKALELYKDGSDELKAILEESFGKDFFGMEITNRIKTYEDACAELGINPLDETKLIGLGLSKHDIVYAKLTTVIEALNEGWVVDVYDKMLYGWVPSFCLSRTQISLAFDVSNYHWVSWSANSGSRLYLKSKELSDYCGQQFLDLWKEFLL